MKAIFKNLLQKLLTKKELLIGFVCIGMTFLGLGAFMALGNTETNANSVSNTDFVVMDRYDRYITNSFSDALEGVLSIKKTYWLSDSDMVAPEPNQKCYGEVSDPKDMQPILDQAKELLEGQELSFSTDVEIQPGSVIRYYYDPTILVITWQIVQDGSVYVISEVKIADASQFRRFLSDGEYGSGSKYLPSEMASSINAVVASSGDYYGVRQIGTIVYNGQLMRMEGTKMDSCYIDKKGDMHLVPAGEITSREEMEQFIADNEIRFGLSFGPILVDNGQTVRFNIPYCVGEVDIPNARAALCQKDSLHYLLVVNSLRPPYDKGVLLRKFAEKLQELGVQKAYNLDGGRSATLVMNDEKINYVFERKLSDIIYFATAISSEE